MRRRLSRKLPPPAFRPRSDARIRAAAEPTAGTAEENAAISDVAFLPIFGDTFSCGGFSETRATQFNTATGLRHAAKTLTLLFQTRVGRGSAAFRGSRVRLVVHSAGLKTQKRTNELEGEGSPERRARATRSYRLREHKGEFTLNTNKSRIAIRISIGLPAGAGSSSDRARARSNERRRVG